MAAKKLHLDPRTRNVIAAIGIGETLLKIIAIIDLVRRRPESVRGKKAAWAAAITAINSAGAVPILYFIFGRRRDAGASKHQAS